MFSGRALGTPAAEPPLCPPPLVPAKAHRVEERSPRCPIRPHRGLFTIRRVWHKPSGFGIGVARPRPWGGGKPAKICKNRGSGSGGGGGGGRRKERRKDRKIGVCGCRPVISATPEAETESHIQGQPEQFSEILSQNKPGKEAEDKV